MKIKWAPEAACFQANSRDAPAPAIEYTAVSTRSPTHLRVPCSACARSKARTEVSPPTSMDHHPPRHHATACFSRNCGSRASTCRQNTCEAYTRDACTNRCKTCTTYVRTRRKYTKSTQNNRALLCRKWRQSNSTTSCLVCTSVKRNRHMYSSRRTIPTVSSATIASTATVAAVGVELSGDERMFPNPSGDNTLSTVNIKMAEEYHHKLFVLHFSQAQQIWAASRRATRTTLTATVTSTALLLLLLLLLPLYIGRRCRCRASSRCRRQLPFAINY